MNKKERFSKKMLAKIIADKVFYLQDKNRFDPDDGWAQVHGKGEEINRDYGEYITLKNLVSQLDISHEMYVEMVNIRNHLKKD